MLHHIILALLPCIFAFCFIEKNPSPAYNFKQPTEIITLPDALHEVSGLTVIDSANIGCVQDENGVLYIYNLAERKLVKEIPFHFDGDYEDITLVKDKLFVLRSDAILYEINNFQSENPDVKPHVTGIPADNSEGLCYDKKNMRLLIAVKGKPDKNPANKEVRLIYSFDLKTMSMHKSPAYRYSIKEVNGFIEKNNTKPEETSTKNKKNPDTPIKFASSAIGIHPLSQQLYLLSARDHMLFIFTNKGHIEQAIPLDPEIYNKAEGLAFFDNGDLVISNEGQDKKPSLVFHRYKK